VIDIGTNSILLLIARWNNSGELETVKQAFSVTRLGDSISRDGVIREDAIDRSMKVLEEYENMARRYRAAKLYVIGTEMMRRAKNAQLFCRMVNKKFGWNVTILSGEEEGRLTYAAAVGGIGGDDQPVMVVDVGGGSTEIVRGIGCQIQSALSLPLGVVRLAENTHMCANLSKLQYLELASEIRASVENSRAFISIAPDTKFIGSGGTITTVAAIKEKMTTYDPEKINGYALTHKDLRAIYRQLNQLSLAERKNLPGMVPGREDILLYGIIIFIVLIELTGLTKIYVTDRGLRYGYLLNIKNTGD